MVDLVGQYGKIKGEIDSAIQNVLDTAQFIKGPAVTQFEESLAQYLNVKHVISCASGTGALQVALMALDLNQGDEVVIPAFTYAATAEVIALLSLKPIMVDVDPNTFNVDLSQVERAVTSKTKVIIPVHLFGQCSDIEDLISFAKEKGIKIIEDNAQSIGSVLTFKNGKKKQAGTLGEIGTTSFFPSKNLGCYGDGGAIFTNDSLLAKKIRMICNHGQTKKYEHSIIGVNSRLDSIQAAILDVKLSHFDTYLQSRNQVAENYDSAFSSLSKIRCPFRNNNSTHTFYQYTIKVYESQRDNLKQYLLEKGIPSMIYYPIPLYKQEAYRGLNERNKELEHTEKLCKGVLSLPIHTEMDSTTQDFIIESVKSFFK